ncbi:MAG: TIGR04219 family outer membrane beta-barrel protein [Arcobacteraceae bacterium]|nr:TIGR04219 family outer membrane beta-barrel protein [Arcobacteraceae bacterium]
MINTKKLLLSTMMASTLMSSANADFLGAEVGYATWGTKLTGDIRKGSDTVDFEKDLGYGSSATNGFIWAYVDHPVPLFPNLKIQQTNFSDTSTSNGTLSKEFDGITFSSTVKSTIELNQLDLIPYWRILDNWVNFDIGFNLKTIQGNLKIDGSLNKSTNTDFSVTIPMLYAKAKFDLPFSGISVEADGSYIGFNGNKISDIKAGVVYQSTIGLGATLGIRQQNLTLDDIDNVYGDMNIKGIYAGLFFHF